MSPLNHPPKWAFKLLKWLCPKDIRDEVAGDLQEVYEWRLAEKGAHHARLRYFLDVLSAFRFYRGGQPVRVISRSMLFSFFKSSFRNFKRELGYTSLNVFGLALGLAATLFILQYISDELNYNRATQADRLYRVSNDYYRFGKMIYESSMTFSGVGPAMKQDLPEVDEFARLYNPGTGGGGASVLTRPDRPDLYFKELQLFFSDASYLEFFDFEVTHGRNALDKPNTMMLSSEMAMKYFGSIDNAVGKTLKYNDRNDEYELLVTGIFMKPDFHLQVETDILISYINKAQSNPERFVNNWGGNAFITFVKVSPDADPMKIQEAMSDLTLRYKPGYTEKNEAGEYNRVNRYFLMPVTDIHLHSDYQNEVGALGDANTVWILRIIALFIVIIAWINFVNLSTARSVQRAREVGVRKVLGSSRAELVAQFVIEALLVNLMAVIMALVLVLSLQTFFNQFTERSLTLQSIDYAMFGPVGLLVFMLGTGLSGLYPALVISNHKVVTALKGTVRATSGMLLRRSLVIFQLLFSSLLIIATLAIHQQLRFMNSQSMGFDMEQVLVLRGPVMHEFQGQEYLAQIDQFKQRVSNVPGVNGIGTSTVIPGQGILRGIVLTNQQGDETNLKSIERVVVSNGFLSTLKMEFLAGEDFNETMEGFSPIILNESAAREMGFQNPLEAIGQHIYEFTREERRIVGIIADYHHESLNRPIDAMYFVRNQGVDRFYAIRTQTADLPNALEQIEHIFKESFPGNPADYYFLDSYFSRQYSKDRVNRKVFSAFALMAILVACLGLYGLSSFSAYQRTKEIGVRKVLGASVPNLFILLSKEVYMLVAVGFALALPLGYWGINQWLDNFAYRMDLSFLLFMVPLLLVFSITFLATASRILQVAIKNPVESLRYE